MSLKNTFFFSPSLPIFPTFFTDSQPLLLLPRQAMSPAGAHESSARGQRGWYELAVAWMKQHVCTAVLSLVPLVAQQPRDTSLGPSQLLGPALLTPGPQHPSEGWMGVSIPDSRKGSADGAQRGARGAHSKCSKFLAGQNRVCWLYLFIFGGEEGYRREKVMI